MVKNIVLQNRYYDSVALMSAAGKIKDHLEARQVSLMMGTDANKEILKATNLLTPEGEKAQAGDLIVSLQIESEQPTEKILEVLEEMMAPKVSTEGEEVKPKTLEGALQILHDANLAVISIPGEHVEYEAEKLMDRGIHLMLFSDNVPLETEIALKKRGEKEDLLVMGPDCGTVIIGGVALGFANKVRTGNIGLVAAAGTGIQEVSTLIHKMGGGVSHAIGTGGRDLSKDVNGITMKMGIRALMEDPETEVLVLISKPPHPDVEKEIYNMVKDSRKPVVVNLLGSDGQEARKHSLTFAVTLEEAAFKAMEAAGREPVLLTPANIEELLKKELAQLGSSQKYLRGLYSGGTLTSETRIILESLGFKLWSNVTKDEKSKLKNPFKSQEDTLVDMGDDVFTKGAPHPMIDSTKRIDRIMEEASDPETAIILMDLVLGYGAHPDPAPELAQAIQKAQKIAHDDGRHIIFVASVCGVPEDPQNLETQSKVFQDAGVIVFPSNASATRFVARVMKEINQTVKTK